MLFFYWIHSDLIILTWAIANQRAFLLNVIVVSTCAFNTIMGLQKHEKTDAAIVIAT